MDGISHGQEPFGAPLLPEQVAVMAELRGVRVVGDILPIARGPGRSPLGMPPAWARTIMQQCAVRLREENMKRGRSLEVEAIAAGIEEHAEGFEDLGNQAFAEAAGHRAHGA